MRRGTPRFPLVGKAARGGQIKVGRGLDLRRSRPTLSTTASRSPGLDWNDRSRRGQDFTGTAHKRISKAFANLANLPDGVKCGGDWFDDSQPSISRTTSSKSPARKAASALIAKIPLPLARHIAAIYHPNHGAT